MLYKAALIEAKGDMTLAIETLRKQGQATATKRAGKDAKQGKVTIVCDPKASCCILYEVNSETDFVARNDDFVKFIADLGTLLLDKKPADISGAKALTSPAFGGQNVDARVLELVAKIGEKITFRRYHKETNGANEALFTYNHGEGRIGVMVKLSCDTAAALVHQAIADLGKDLSMQVAASNPLAIDRVALDKRFPSLVEKEKEIYFTQAQTSGKPEKVWAKIVEGKLDKFYKDSTLIQQPYIRDPERTVADRIAETEKAVSAKITVASFVRFELGAEE